MSRISPLTDHVLIERLDAPGRSKGGIILPDISKEQPTEGKVIAVGKGKVNETTGERIPLEVTPGQRVLFGKYAAIELDIDGQKLTMVRETDIIAVVED